MSMCHGCGKVESPAPWADLPDGWRGYCGWGDRAADRDSPDAAMVVQWCSPECLVVFVERMEEMRAELRALLSLEPGEAA